VKKFLIVLLMVALIAGALAFYLEATTPRTSAGVRFPLTLKQRQLLASVPASAEAFALIPTAAAFREKLFSNPITRSTIEQWVETEQLPRSWMLGDSDLVAWSAGKRTAFAIHLDPLRAALVRIYLMMGSGLDARVSDGALLINAGAGEPLGLARLDQLLALTNDLEPADALVVQQAASRGAFPPVGRPAVTTVKVGSEDVDLISRSLSEAPPPAASPLMRPRSPRGALIAATFREPPRIVSDLDRLFIARVSHLLDDGGSIVLYDVNTGTLLPRPNGLMIAKATPDNRQTVERIKSAVAWFGEIRDAGDQLLVSFDKTSLTAYSTDTLVDAQWPSNDWSARVDPKRAVPLLVKLGDNTGLRLAAPRIYRAARDLRRWIEPLSGAESIEAAHSFTGSTEELRVRISVIPSRGDGEESGRGQAK
jgi:hypothetical protein